MIKITVGLNRQCIITDDGRKMIVFLARARIGKCTRFLREWRGVACTDVKVSIRWWIFRHQLNLPQELMDGIVEFLREYSTRGEEFDCYAFVNLVYDIRPHWTRYLLKYWNTSPLSGEPQVGQVVFLMTEEKNMFHHAAIYLGLGFYISVYGAGGGLEIASLEDMKRDYGAADIVLATPRPQRPPIF